MRAEIIALLIAVALVVLASEKLMAARGLIGG